MKQRIASLDGVRAIAIVLVFLNHLSATIRAPHLVSVVFLYLGNSDLGVEAFFVLSGFIITKLLIDEFERSGRIDIFNFYLRRARRILPAFYVWLSTLSVLTIFRVIDLKASDLIGTALFVRNYLPGNKSWWTGNSWTLSIEEIFYLFFPAIVIYLGYQKATLPLLVIVIAEPLIRILELHSGVASSAVAFQPHTRLDTIACGCLLAIYLRKPSIRCWFLKKTASRVAIVACFVVLIAIPSLSAKLPVDFRLLFGFSVDAIGIVFILGYLLEHPQSNAARMLSLKPVVWLGMISYSLYLWQQPFLTFLNPIPVVFKVACAVGCACISYYLIERRFTASRHKRTSAISAA